MGDLAQSQSEDRLSCPRQGLGLSVTWENIQKSVSQTLNTWGGGDYLDCGGKNRFILTSVSNVLGEPRHRRLGRQPHPASRAFRSFSFLKKKIDIIFRTVLGSQQNWAKSAVSICLVCSQAQPPRHQRGTRAVCLLQLAELHRHIIITSSPYLTLGVTLGAPFKRVCTDVARHVSSVTDHPEKALCPACSSFPPLDLWQPPTLPLSP